MAELKILTVAVIGAGAEGIASAIAANLEAAANDILYIVTEKSNLQANFDSLTEMFGELEEGFDALKLEHEALAKINAELQAQIEAGPVAAVVVAKPTLSDKTFTHNKKEYGFVYPQLRFEGAIITADDVVKDKKLQEKLVEMESGFIKLV